MTFTTHIIGAGLAGLSAAAALSGEGRRVVLYEATAIAGGRCRSYYDESLGCVIDNGNHVLLACNKAAMAFITRIGSQKTFYTHPQAAFPFYDLSHNTRHSVSPFAHMPTASPRHYWQLFRLLSCKNPKRSVAEYFTANNPWFSHLIDSFCRATLNTAPQEASALQCAQVLRHCLIHGRKGMRVMLAQDNLDSSLISPALEYIKNQGGEIIFNAPLRQLNHAQHKRIGSLIFAEFQVQIAEHDMVILAVPPYILNKLMPELTLPEEYNCIINAHFLYGRDDHNCPPLLGVLNGTSEWISKRAYGFSTTTSAASHLAHANNEELAHTLWREICTALSLGDSSLPPYRIIKEKRATISCNTKNLANRPVRQTKFDNMLLAGDALASIFPPTIEAAIHSGMAAAEHILRQSRK